MSTKDEEDFQVLTQLGLTILQAKVYFTLVKTGKATLKQISSATQTERANVHRVVLKLQELNLIEKMLTRPTIFEAVPLQEGISMLMEHRAKENQEIEDKIRILLTRHEQKTIETVLEEDECQFILVTKEKGNLRKLGEMLGQVQKTFDMIFYWSHLKPNVNDVIKISKTLLRKGIKIRFIAYSKMGEVLPVHFLNMTKNGSFEIRCIFSPPRSTMSIIDHREALIATSSKIPALESASLWVNNSGIVGIFQDFFELMWQISKTPKPKKVNDKRKGV